MFNFRNNGRPLHAVVALSCFAIGCHSQFDAQVTGKVSLDGTVLKTGDVVFHGRDGTPGYGAIQPDGSYEIASAGQIGLKSGEYTVTVVSLGPPSMPSDGGMPSPGKHMVPASYSSLSTTDLKANVLPGKNEVHLELRSH